MNPLGLVVAPIINLFNNKKRTRAYLVRFWALGGVVKSIKTTLVPLMLALSLCACQYLPLVNSPLPVTLTPPPNQNTTPTPPAPPICHDNPTDMADTTDSLCTPQPTKPFFILENWF